MSSSIPHLAPIPSPPLWPVVGSLVGHLPLFINGLIMPVLEVSKTYPDGIFALKVPSGEDVVAVCRPDLVAEVCDESRFHKAVRGPLQEVRRFAGDGLFTAYHGEPNWQVAHDILMPGFTNDAMGRYFPQMLEIAGNLVTAWQKAADTQKPVDVADDMTRLTLDTISLAGFDYRFRSFEAAQLHPFLQAMGRALSQSAERLRRLPGLGFMYKDDDKNDLADIKTMSDMVDDVIRARKKEPQETWPRDFLSMLLAGTDKKGNHLSDENIRYQILTFLIAGHETTSGLLAFTLYFLTKNPQYLDEMRAEVDEIFGDISLDNASENPQALPTREKVLALKATQRALFEALRLWPTAPVFSVQPYKDEMIGGKYPLPQGTRVVVLIPALHRWQESWGSDAENFDPTRFLPEKAAGRHPHAYKPFGNGKRSCIGRQFALVEAQLALAMIVKHFDFTTPAPYDLKIKELLTIKPDAFSLLVRRRAAR